jgi:GTP-dependent phosphoenolpyruvate carboxykinase
MDNYIFYVFLFFIYLFITFFLRSNKKVVKPKVNPPIEKKKSFDWLDDIINSTKEETQKQVTIKSSQNPEAYWSKNIVKEGFDTEKAFKNNEGGSVDLGTAYDAMREEKKAKILSEQTSINPIRKIFENKNQLKTMFIVSEIFKPKT